MNKAKDALAIVRAELCDEIDRITRDLPRVRLETLSRRVATIRATATEFGLLPFAEIARALSQTLDDGGRSPLVPAYLGAMRDAAGCARADADAGRAFVASIGVRMVG